VRLIAGEIGYVGNEPAARATLVEGAAYSSPTGLPLAASP